MSRDAESFVAAIRALGGAFQDAGTNASGADDYGRVAYAAINIPRKSLQGVLGSQANRRHLETFIEKAGLPPPDAISLWGSRRHRIYYVEWNIPEAWVPVAWPLSWSWRADAAAWPTPCCGPLLEDQRADDSSWVEAHCVVCEAEWKWTAPLSPTSGEGWQRHGRGSSAERAVEFAPILELPGDRDKRPPDPTSLERFLDDDREGEDEDGRFTAEMEGASFWIIGPKKDVVELPPGIRMKTVSILEDDRIVLAIVAFSSGHWFRQILWRHPGWFDGRLPRQITGSELRETVLDFDVGIELNPNTALEFSIPPPSALGIGDWA